MESIFQEGYTKPVPFGCDLCQVFSRQGELLSQNRERSGKKRRRNL